MRKKDNHTDEPSKLTRFQTIEEMKAAPFSFPTRKSPAQRLSEYKEAFAKLRSTYNNHTAKPFKVTVFQTIEEMKATPASFPSAKPLAQRKAAQKDAYSRLRSTFSANHASRQKKTNKKATK